MPKFNESLYKASLDVLLTANVPLEIAEQASKVVASDDGDLLNFGRSAEDQKIVNDAMQHYWEGQTEERD